MKFIKYDFSLFIYCSETKMGFWITSDSTGIDNAFSDFLFKSSIEQILEAFENSYFMYRNNNNKNNNNYKILIIIVHVM